ncbi:Os11g0562600, partial [Oryza sativa Japonica Group]
PLRTLASSSQAPPQSCCLLIIRRQIAVFAVLLGAAAAHTHGAHLPSPVPQPSAAPLPSPCKTLSAATTSRYLCRQEIALMSPRFTRSSTHRLAIPVRRRLCTRFS